MLAEEFVFLAILIVLTIGAAAALLAVFARFRPHWSRRRAALLAALPVPGLVWALCIAVFVYSATMTAEECGGDVCAMGMLSALFIGMLAFVAFAASFAAAWVMHRIFRR